MLLLLALGVVPVCMARQVDLTAYASVLEDPAGEFTFEQVSSGPVARRFVPAETGGGLNFGYSDSVYWVRVPLAAEPGRAPQRLLEVGYFTLEHIEFFAPGKAPILAGRHHPGATGTWPYRHTVFPVALQPAPEYFYLRVKSSGSVTIPLVLWDPQEFESHNQRLYLGLGLYYGALAVLVVYNLLLFLSLRERNYILYSTFAALLGLGIVSGNGIGHQFLWPTWTTWSTLFSTFALALAVVFAIPFSQCFLDTRRHTPRLHRLLWGLIPVFGLIAAAPFIGISPRLAEEALVIFGIVTAMLFVSASVIALRRGQRSARFYLVAWGVLWTGATIAGLRNFGWVPTNDFTAYAVQLSSSVEMLLLSFALADRIHLEREAKEQAQSEAIAAKQIVVETLQSSEQRLEKMVRERTDRLDQALRNEQQVLRKYVRFGALISHEFRNPLAIIKSQSTLMAKELERGIDHGAKRLQAITGAASRLELMFEEWLQSDRLSRSAAEMHPVTIDLPEWLGQIAKESASCYSEHEFHLRLDPEAGQVVGDESMLRIALHNLLDNAAKYSAAGTPIAIHTVRREGMTGIAVSDQGKGISEADRGRIYEEYFRVQPEGAVGGFGLGLAFVNRIMQLHGGQVELGSEAGKGSRFCLWLPDPKPFSMEAAGGR